MRKDEEAAKVAAVQAMKITDEPKASPPLEAVAAASSAAGPAPDPEVTDRPMRRSFTAEFKRQVLQEAEACKEPGAVGALLRRHGLYASHLVTWRQQRDAGELAGLAPKRRGRKRTPKNPLADDVARLERENHRLLARAERAERLVELQKKSRSC